MSKLTIQLPDSLQQQVERLALHDGISVEQFLALAAAEKVSALETGNYLAQRASRADRDAFLKVLAKVPTQSPSRGTGCHSDAAEAGATITEAVFLVVRLTHAWNNRGTRRGPTQVASRRGVRIKANQT